MIKYEVYRTLYVAKESESMCKRVRCKDAQTSIFQSFPPRAASDDPSFTALAPSAAAYPPPENRYWYAQCRGPTQGAQQHAQSNLRKTELQCIEHTQLQFLFRTLTGMQRAVHGLIQRPFHRRSGELEDTPSIRDETPDDESHHVQQSDSDSASFSAPQHAPGFRRRVVYMLDQHDTCAGDRNHLAQPFDSNLASFSEAQHSPTFGSRVRDVPNALDHLCSSPEVSFNKKCDSPKMHRPPRPLSFGDTTNPADEIPRMQLKPVDFVPRSQPRSKNCSLSQSGRTNQVDAFQDSWDSVDRQSRPSSQASERGEDAHGDGADDCLKDSHPFVLLGGYSLGGDSRFGLQGHCSTPVVQRRSQVDHDGPANKFGKRN
eukprot:5823097-Pleurochrysis_carterae.AAC.3